MIADIPNLARCDVRKYIANDINYHGYLYEAMERLVNKASNTNRTRSTYPNLHQCTPGHRPTSSCIQCQ